MPRTTHARQRPPARRDKPAVAGERTRQTSLRVALLALAIARAGSEGISWEDLATLPFVQAIYHDGEQARYAAIRRDMLVLTGKALRAQRQSPSGQSAVRDERSNTIEPPVYYDAALGRYRLRGAGAGPLRLGAEAIEALCMVARALRGGAGLPGGRELFARLAEALGEEERRRLTIALQSEAKVASGDGITLEFGLRETMGGLERVLGMLWRAWRQRQTVKFSYRAAHKVTDHYGDEVLEIWLADHAYACLWCEEANKPIEVRLDRILPETLAFAPNTARGRTHRGIPVRYRLDASVARGEVTQRLADQSVQWEEETGAAIVSGRARSLFWARRLLLSYGGNAQALEPPPLVAEMRREAERIRKLYVSPE